MNKKNISVLLGIGVFAFCVILPYASAEEASNPVSETGKVVENVVGGAASAVSATVDGSATVASKTVETVAGHKSHKANKAVKEAKGKGKNVNFTPKGWSQGKKTGWDGASVPPGKEKKGGKK